MVLFFKNRNRPDARIEGINNDNKNGIKYLKVNFQLDNLLFLRINNTVYPIFHDHAYITLTIPIQKDKYQLVIRGIGALKSTKQLKIEADKFCVVELSSLRSSRTGHLRNTPKGVHNFKVDLPERPRLLISDPQILSEEPRITQREYAIKSAAFNLKSPKAREIELNEQGLLLELNQQL